ncbi:MAG: hypothetical protein SF069_18470 [Phycisphaerae bacterium]|nr:hypothetical protein [Phycisphaerae bacterium]
MLRKFALFTSFAVTIATLVGCSAASTGLSVFRNTKSNKLDTVVYLDGIAAKRNELKQAATGSSSYKIKEPVSTSPSFKYEARKEGGLGRISSTTISIHKMMGKNPSDQAEYTIYSTTQDVSGALQPGTNYNLTSLPSNYKVMNWQRQQVPGISLQPGTEYMLQFVLTADNSETAQIYFTTK